MTFGVRHPQQLRPLLAELGGKVKAGSATDAVAGADVVLAAIPFRAWPDIAREIEAALGDKVLLDATVPDPPRDGAFGDAALARKDGVAPFRCPAVVARETGSRLLHGDVDDAAITGASCRRQDRRSSCRR